VKTMVFGSGYFALVGYPLMVQFIKENLHRYFFGLGLWALVKFRSDGP